MTALLVALSVGAYVAQLLLEYMLAEHPLGKDILSRWLALDHAGIVTGEYWKFLSYSLLHFSVLQVLMSMLLLFCAGKEVEPIVGIRHFLSIYFGGMLVGGVASWLALPAAVTVAGKSTALMVMGTTPAVLAVMVAFATILPELEVTVNLLFVLPLRIRAKHLAVASMIMSGVLWATKTIPQIGAPGLVAAGVFAWVYVKQLGFGNPLAIQRYIFDRRQRAARLDRMTAEQFISMEIDPILEKISREGVRSLSRAERKILERGREKIDDRPDRK